MRQSISPESQPAVPHSADASFLHSRTRSTHAAHHDTLNLGDSSHSSHGHRRTNSTSGSGNNGMNNGTNNGTVTRSLLEIASRGARSIFQRKKEVRFRRYDQIQEIPSAKDHPPAIFDALYYTKQDMRRVTADRKRSVAELSESKRAHPVLTNGHGHIHADHWGLETRDESDDRNRQSHEAIMAVLVEQELQWEEGAGLDDVLIAEAYDEFTFRPKLEAHQRALRVELETQRSLCAGGRWDHDKQDRGRGRGKKTKRHPCMSKPVRQPKRQSSIDKHAPRRSHSERFLGTPVRGLVRQLSDSEVSVSTYSGDESDSSTSIPTPVTASKRPIQMPIRQTSDPRLCVPLDSPLSPAIKPTVQLQNPNLMSVPMPMHQRQHQMPRRQQQQHHHNRQPPATPQRPQQPRRQNQQKPQEKTQRHQAPRFQQRNRGKPNARGPAMPQPSGPNARVVSDNGEMRRSAPNRSPSDSKPHPASHNRHLSSNSMENLMIMRAATEHAMNNSGASSPPSPMHQYSSNSRNIHASPITFAPQSSISLPPTSGGLSSWVRI